VNTCGSIITWTAPTASDNCAVTSFTSTHESGDTFLVGTTTVTYTALDAAGNSSTCSFTVTVNDTQAPGITCPADVSVNTDLALCTASGVDLGMAITGDNCGVFSVTNDAPATFPVGQTTVTWTVLDIHGNSTSCTQIVTVTDNQAPSITCAATVNAFADAGQCFATGIVLMSPVTSDNCGVDTVTNNAPATYPVGSTTVTWTVMDVNGNTATCTQVVNVTDDQLPTISCPASVSVDADLNECFASNVTLDTPVTGDNCGVSSVTNNAPSTFPLGNTTVTWTVVDVNGNTATCTQTVSVGDAQAPVFTLCPSNITVTTNEGLCDGQMASWSAPVATDFCGTTTLTQTAGPASGSIFPLGVTTISYEATDLAGNTASCSFTVTVSIVDADNDGICDFLDGCPELFGQNGDSCDDGNPNTTNDVITDCACGGTPFVVANVVAILDGATQQSGTATPLVLMRDNLRTLNLIPASQPYNVTPFNYAGTETIGTGVLAVSGQDAIVDWVLVELRSFSAPYEVVATRAALIQRDGDIVDTDGVSPVRFMGMPVNNYQIAVRHRNHLGIMTMSSVLLDHNSPLVDLTDAATSTYGTAARKLDALGRQTMWCGNARADAVIRYVNVANDRDAILLAIGGSTPTAVVGGYRVEDVNLNGLTSYAGSMNDRDPILVTIGGLVTNQRFQQLP
jgi:hypothetical protein